MPNPCQKPLCAGYGHFEGNQCPGSDSEDEMHHCCHCGELTWEDKGNHCERCGAYWCQIGWQHTFVFPDCDNFQGNEDSVCSECFLADPSCWCSDPNCYCQCKRDKVQNEYVEFSEHGILVGSGRMIKGNERFFMSLYRYQGESRARLFTKEAGNENSLQLESLHQAKQTAQGIIKTRFAQGYVWDAKQSPYERNPYGLD